MQETLGQGADRLIDWSVRGEIRSDSVGVEQVWLHLTLAASVCLTCQRCLGPVDIAVLGNHSYRFVGSEEEARAQDEKAEEDVLALSCDFNLAELIEDEVLLALPLIALHEKCPVEIKLTGMNPGFDAAATKRPNAFTVLAKLRAGKSG